MKKLMENYRLIVIAMAMFLFFPTHSVYPYEWEFYTYSESDQTGDLYYGWDGHVYKEIDITEHECSRNFDEENGSGFEMDGSWTIYVEAEVGSSFERYSNTISLTGKAYNTAEEDWEWSGPAGTAPGAQVEYYLSASGSQITQGNIYLTTGTPTLESSGLAEGSAYSWVHDSQNSEWMYVDAEVSGNVTNLVNSADRYWDNSHSVAEPGGREDSDEDDFIAEYLSWEFGSGFYDTYYVQSGIGLFTATGQVHGQVDADVYCEVKSDQSGSALSYGTSEITGHCSFTMTSN